MIRFVLFAAFVLGLVGCARQSQADAQPTPEPPRVVLAAPEPAPQPAVPPKNPGADGTGSPSRLTAFEYPSDLGGQMAEKATVPAAPPMPPTEKFGIAP